MIVLIWLYIISLFGALIYGGYQFYLALLYQFSKRKLSEPSEPENWPMVTVQLPIYNERYVVERLLDKIIELDYPKDKLEIQILDDSDDETITLIQKWLQHQKSKFEIQHIRREKREGFKAGALRYGMEKAKGVFYVIFDADFLPDSNFLKKAIPYFEDPELGVVQTRWGFINRDYSMLTNLQTLALDAHFTIEQGARNRFGHFINFNGTGGIWRKECIIDGGNWDSETLTEDLDLSYRSQFQGWKFKYIEEHQTPSELPVNIFALKKQQFRWNKGGAQNLRKHLPKLISSANMRFSDRLHGFLHLLNSSVYVFVLFALIMSFPVVMITRNYPETQAYFHFSWIFLILNFLLIYVYWIGYSNTHKGGLINFIRFIPKFFLFLFLSFGLTIHNTLAVLEGWLGIKSAFIRTPKYNIVNGLEEWEDHEYVQAEIGFVEILELVFGMYFLGATYFNMIYGDVIMTIFHGAVALGFLIIWSFSFRLWWKLYRNKKKRIAAI